MRTGSVMAGPMAEVGICCFSVCLKRMEQVQSPANDNSLVTSLLSGAVGLGRMRLMFLSVLTSLSGGISLTKINRAFSFLTERYYSYLRATACF